MGSLQNSLGEEKNLPVTPLRPLPSLPAGDSLSVSASTRNSDLSACLALDIAAELSLGQAVQQALCNNPQTRQAWANAIAQAAGLGSARSSYLPSATAAIGRTRDASNLGPSVTASTKNLSLAYILFDFGLRDANLDSARQLLTAALASQDAALQVVFMNTTSAYYEAAIAKASLQAALDAQKAALESFNAAQARFKQGAGTPTDALQARAAYSKSVLDRVKAEGAALLTRGNLANAIGLPAQTELVLKEDLKVGLKDSTSDLARLGGPTPAANSRSHSKPGQQDDAQGGLETAVFAQTLEALMEQAQQSHPTIVAARAQLKAAERRVNATAAEGLPSLSVTGARYLNGRPATPLSSARSQETTYGITLNIPLFEGFGRIAKVNAAQAQALSKSIELSNAELQVSLDVWRAYQELQSQTAALSASQDLINSTIQAYQAMQARYRAGAAGIVDVLNTQSAFASGQQQRVETVGKWRAAQLKLLGTLGLLGFWAVPEGQ